MGYCCGDYIGLLRMHEVQPSMTSNGDPLENPIAERVNRTIKEEFMENYKEGYPENGKVIINKKS